MLGPVLLDLWLPHNTVGTQVEVCHGGGDSTAVGATTSCSTTSRGEGTDSGKKGQVCVGVGGGGSSRVVWEWRGRGTCWELCAAPAADAAATAATATALCLLWLYVLGCYGCH